MRSLFAALLVLALSVALLSRSVLAEAPPQMEERKVSTILTALAKKPELKATLAALRFHVEVGGGTSLRVPVGSQPEEADGALGAAEASLTAAECRETTPAELKAASALLAEYGEVLPVTLRAWTLGHQGKKAQAADLLAGVIDQQLAAGKCPSEHPNNSYARVARISRVLECLQSFAPKRDVKKQKGVLEHAEACARNNSAEG